jgi:hypothetical protein
MEARKKVAAEVIPQRFVMARTFFLALLTAQTFFSLLLDDLSEAIEPFICHRLTIMRAHLRRHARHTRDVDNRKPISSPKIKFCFVFATLKHFLLP